MKTLIVAIFLFLSCSIVNAEVIILPIASFDLKTTDVTEKLEDTLLNPEHLLKRYRPGGAKIDNKLVARDQFQFLATKTIFNVRTN